MRLKELKPNIVNNFAYIVTVLSSDFLSLKFAECIGINMPVSVVSGIFCSDC